MNFKIQWFLKFLLWSPHQLMNFKILWSFDFWSPHQGSKPYDQIKQTESKSAKKWQRSSIFHWFWARTHTRTKMYGARFIVPSLTSLGGDISLRLSLSLGGDKNWPVVDMSLLLQNFSFSVCATKNPNWYLNTNIKFKYLGVCSDLHIHYCSKL